MLENKAKEKSSRILPVIFGCRGTVLSAEERDFFASANPFGFILFKRNCEKPQDVRWLVKELRQAVGRPDAPVFIDQEGGRVLRLVPPHWARYPAARVIGKIYETAPAMGLEVAGIVARLMAYDLRQLGVNVNCTPVLDLLVDGASDVIGDRAFGKDVDTVITLGRMVAETFLNHGIIPIIKHIPGYGRLKTDPHLVLPTIDTPRVRLEEADFKPFIALHDMPMAMNSHAIFSWLDAGVPASLSSTINNQIIRKHIGFDGLLIADDVCMKALNGNMGDLARGTLAAGADVVLHCDGDLASMQMIAKALDGMTVDAWARWERAHAMVGNAGNIYKPDADNLRLDVILGGFGGVI